MGEGTPTMNWAGNTAERSDGLRDGMGVVARVGFNSIGSVAASALNLAMLLLTSTGRAETMGALSKPNRCSKVMKGM